MPSWRDSSLDRRQLRSRARPRHLDDALSPHDALRRPRRLCHRSRKTPIPSRAITADQPVSAGRRGRRRRPSRCRYAGADRQAAGRDRDQGRRRWRRSARRSPPTPSPTATRCWCISISISGFAEVDKLFGRQPKFTRADFIPLARFIADPMRARGATTRNAVQDAEGTRRRRQEAAGQVIFFSSVRSLRRAPSSGRSCS